MEGLNVIQYRVRVAATPWLLIRNFDKYKAGRVPKERKIVCNSDAETSRTFFPNARLFLSPTRVVTRVYLYELCNVCN